VAPGNSRALRLARRLRELRESEWPGVRVTQQELAKALSAEGTVAPATISSYESSTNTKTPSPARLTSYARFFATRRSLDPEPHLINDDDLKELERERFLELVEELLALRAAVHENRHEDRPVREARRTLLSFNDSGPLVIICPEAPEDSRGPLADESNHNFTRLHQYADLDALIEIFGHIRALNPEMHVLHRLPSTVQSEELQNHLVVLGGIGWNRTVRRILSELKKLPIQQVEDPRVPTGEVFKVTTVKQDGEKQEEVHLPAEEEVDGVQELTEDLALLARLPNPFNSGRTLTICNGVYSRGVVGAVLTVTDETVRPGNEAYLARRFPTGAFAMLVRVPVVSGKVLAPDLQNPDKRLFEWSPEPATRE
jgi:hypothetical protein